MHSTLDRFVEKYFFVVLNTDVVFELRSSGWSGTGLLDTELWKAYKGRCRHWACELPFYKKVILKSHHCVPGLFFGLSYGWSCSTRALLLNPLSRFFASTLHFFKTEGSLFLSHATLWCIKQCSAVALLFLFILSRNNYILLYTIQLFSLFRNTCPRPRLSPLFHPETIF